MDVYSPLQFPRLGECCEKEVANRYWLGCDRYMIMSPSKFLKSCGVLTGRCTARKIGPPG